MVARTLLIAAMLWTLAARGARAQETAEATREVRDTLGSSVNNAGLQNTIDVSWKRSLSASSSALRRDAHITLGLSHALSPAYTRVGAWAEVAPLSILDVRVGIEPALYFGSFNSLMSFERYDDRFDSDGRNARSGQAHSGSAMRAYVSPTLKMKVGSVIAVGSADLEWWRSSAAGPLFYEPARDTLLRASGERLVATSGLLLHERDLGPAGTLACGLMHQLTYVAAAPENRIQRVGAVAVRQYKGKRFGREQLRIVGYLSYYLNDPFKQGQLGAALAVSFKLGR